MTTFSNSPLSYMKYPNYVEEIGDPDTIYTITLPGDVDACYWWASKDLSILPAYFKNVQCVIDPSKIASRLDNLPRKVDQYFIVNEHLFMADDRDKILYKPFPNYSKYITAFFIFSHRYSTTYIFKNTSPAYPLPGKYSPYLSVRLECDAHSKSLQSKKDIPVFFSGRHTVRVARKYFGKIIMQNFPNSHIHFLENGKFVSRDEYVDLMIRSKIAWCPRSVWSPPDRDCNIPVGQEYDAMPLELLIIKHPLGTIEAEERIAGVHFVEYKNDSSDLIEKIQYYLEHEDERKEIARNGRLWWERNCSTIARANFIMNSCLRSMGHPFKDSPCYERVKL